MIKRFCDRCEREIKEEKNPKGIFESLTKALGQLFADDPTEYVICRARLATEEKYVPLTLCKDCKEDLKQFMTKTEIHACIADPDAEIKKMEEGDEK